MTLPHTRKLLVEGPDDMRVVPELVKSVGIDWGPVESPIVGIKYYNGVDELLSRSVIGTELKASGLKYLGIMVDADEDAARRWDQIRRRIEGFYTDIPDKLSEEGVVLDGDEFPAFGAWIMPDNRNRGMLETFLLFLRPMDNQPLLSMAEDTVRDAQKLGAPFKSAHEDKARIHTWLAWQDPPGRQMHQSIMKNMLTHRPECFRQFIQWFCRLYDLELPLLPL